MCMNFGIAEYWYDLYDFLLENTLQPSPRNVLRQRLAIFSNEYYQILIATHLPTPKGWKAELAWALRVQITCSRLLLDSGPGWTRTRDLWVTGPRYYHYVTEPHNCDVSIISQTNVGCTIL